VRKKEKDRTNPLMLLSRESQNKDTSMEGEKREERPYYRESEWALRCGSVVED
jgi:hypothetical protein